MGDQTQEIYRSYLERASKHLLSCLEDVNSDNFEQELDTLLFPFWEEAVKDISRLTGQIVDWEKMSRAEKIVSAPEALSFENFKTIIVESFKRVFLSHGA